MKATLKAAAQVAVSSPVFMPWSYPAAVGAVVGASVAAAVTAGALTLAAAFVLTAAISLSTALGARAVSARLAPTAVSRRAVVLATACALLAGGRYVAWEFGSDPLAGLHGVETTWTGYHDGVYFHATSPVMAKLVLASSAAQPRGRLVLTGNADRAQGLRNPGGFDYAAYLKRRGVSGQLFVDQVTSVQGVGPLRERLRAGVEAGLSPEAAALMAAMTLGLREDMGALSDSFTAAGLAHLLALSGLHVSVILVGAGRALARHARARPYLLMLLTLGFVALVGPSPSVVRAAAMALAVLVAMAVGAGRPQAWPVYALALAGGLVVQPQMLFDVSFQLSYLAVGGMLLFLPPWTRALRLRPVDKPGRLKLLVLGGGLTSVAAQLPSVSIVAGGFGQLPLLSPFVNIVAVPISVLSLPLALAAGLLGVVWLPLAWLVNRVQAVLAAALIACARVGERLPSLTWGEVGWAGHMGWAAVLLALALWSRGRLKVKSVALVVLAAASSTALAGPRFTAPDVWFLDVGQGDSVLVRLPRGAAVLIDGGGTPFSDFDVGQRIVLRAMRALGVRRLDAVVATHPDTDHIEGLITVLESVPVGVLITGPPTEAPLDVLLRAVAERRGVPVHEARRGERLNVGGGPYSFDVLHPPAGTREPESNERSVALVLREGTRALAVFIGDLGSVSERMLAAPPAEVLMAGHHGSRHSTSDFLLSAVSPRYAVISVGRNNYGHPHPDVIERLESREVETFLTLVAGAVRFDLRTGVVEQPFQRAVGAR